MKRIAILGAALAAVSMLLGGCAGGTPHEPLHTTVETPYYTVMLPASYAASVAVGYDESYRLDEETGEGVGFCTSVCDLDTGEPLWHVLCATPSYGPDPGFPRTVDKGAPSAWPTARVYVAQPIFPMEAPDQVSRYERYVTAKRSQQP